jgi:predicted GNAT family acetyltransferase
MYVWDNNGPTTLITLSGFTENGVRISAVYTPVEHRGHGYASIAVAKMCDELFAKGYSFVTLVAIDGDPAEKIYRRLGFKKIGSRACYILMPLLHDMD